MSREFVITTKENSEPLTHPFPVRISQMAAQRLNAIATARQVKVGVLINEILEQYIAEQCPITQQSGAEFLLSLAGMFSSGESDTSENVHPIVTDFISDKHKEKSV